MQNLLNSVIAITVARALQLPSLPAVLAALASTVQFGFYVVEDVMLGYLRALLRHVRNRPSLEVSAGDMLLLSSSVLYNSMHRFSSC